MLSSWWFKRFQSPGCVTSGVVVVVDLVVVVVFTAVVVSSSAKQVVFTNIEITVKNFIVKMSPETLILTRIFDPSFSFNLLTYSQPRVKANEL